jgi:hypothetical protein
LCRMSIWHVVLTQSALWIRLASGGKNKVMVREMLEEKPSAQ